MATTISHRFLKRCRIPTSATYGVAVSSSLLATGYVPSYTSSFLTLGSASSPTNTSTKASSLWYQQSIRGAKSGASELRGGDLIEHGEPGNVWRVMDQHFVRQAMGRAFMQVELRHIKLGTKKEVRFRTDELVEKVELEPPKKLQVLYWDQEKISFMDSVSFEQSELPLTLLGDAAAYVQEGMIVTVEMYQGEPAIVHVPPKVVFEIKEVTAMPSGTVKEQRDVPAVLSNGVRVKVPKFIKVGDRVVIDTSSGKYLGKE